MVNAGDGWHAHPTQALLDLLDTAPRIGSRVLRPASRLVARAKIAIVGDILHSRVAQSNIWTLSQAGADVWVSGPEGWLRGYDALPVTATPDLERPSMTRTP